MNNIKDQIEILDMIQKLILKGMQELKQENTFEGAKDIHLAYKGLELFLDEVEKVGGI